MEKKKKVWLYLMIIFVVIALAGIVLLLWQGQSEKQAKDTLEQTVKAVNEPVETTEAVLIQQAETEDALQGIGIPEKNLDWAELKDQNKDIYAWIYVPGTDVDYPILRHETDNEYYLNHNLDGSEGLPGCIYTEDYNSKDFTDIHTVINGHNISKGASKGMMFSSLHNFEDKDFFAKDNYIFIYTPDKVLVYQVFAAYEYRAIHLLDNFDYTNEYVYADYLKHIYETTDRVANVRNDIAVTTEDKILTLSTCTSDHDSDLRFLVTGVLLNKDAAE